MPSSSVHAIHFREQLVGAAALSTSSANADDSRSNPTVEEQPAQGALLALSKTSLALVRLANHIVNSSGPLMEMKFPALVRDRFRQQRLTATRWTVKQHPTRHAAVTISGCSTGYCAVSCNSCLTVSKRDVVPGVWYFHHSFSRADGLVLRQSGFEVVVADGHRIKISRRFHVFNR